MKKISMILMTTIAVAFTACGQNIDASKVPAAVKDAFVKEYPGVSAKWEKEDGNYEVTFKKDGAGMSLIITPAGNILETEVDIKTTELPAPALAYVKEHYPGKTIKEASKITKADHRVNFEARVNGKDVIFDSNGKFLKISKD